jgi:Polyketide cyclase / dehydrase and lipid transport
MLRRVEASAYIKVPRRLAFAVLAAYESYRDWMPDVLESRVLAAEGDISVVELVAPEFSRGKFIVEFVVSPDDWLMYRQVDRYRQDGVSGRWDLDEADGGESVVVRGSVCLRNSLFGFGSRARMQQVMERTLDALASRSLRLAAHGSAPADLRRRKIFELVKTADTLAIDFNGATYQLVRQGDGEAG